MPATELLGEGPREAPRVLIVDRDARVRDGLRGVLELDSGVLVIGEAASAQEAVEMDGKLSPDVVFLDLSLPTALDGLAVVRELAARDRAVVATSINGGVLSSTALAAGAIAFMEKSRSAADGLPMLLRAASGAL
jgi:DNA-binding NarL/FixJ family response regulator